MDYKIADRLIALRKAHGYSQEELADKLNISRQAVSKWERAESLPDAENLMALANFYTITIDKLIYGDNTATTDNTTPQQSDYFAPNSWGNYHNPPTPTAPVYTTKKIRIAIILGSIGIFLGVMGLILGSTLGIVDNFLTILTIIGLYGVPLAIPALVLSCVNINARKRLNIKDKPLPYVLAIALPATTILLAIACLIAMIVLMST